MAADDQGDQLGQDSNEMDEKRQQQIAYEYLCHLEEAKTWLEEVLKETLPTSMELEESLCNGVILAKLAALFAPSVVNTRKIFDIDQRKFAESGLHFRHTDNINYFLAALQCIRLPDSFIPETTDIYNKKNIPKLIFCIHALSHLMFNRRVLANQIKDLYGKVAFSQNDITHIQNSLQEQGMSQLPQFRNIGGILAEELQVARGANPEVDPVQVAVGQVNQALKLGNKKQLMAALQNPVLGLSEFVSAFAMPLYLAEMSYVSQKAELKKEGIARLCRYLFLMAKINETACLRNVDQFRSWLTNPETRLTNVESDFMHMYANIVLKAILDKERRHLDCVLLNCAEIQDCIDAVNSDNRADLAIVDSVKSVNRAVEQNDPIALFKALQAPALKLDRLMDKNEQLALKLEDAAHCLDIMHGLLQNMSVTENEECDLWLEHIEEAVRTCRRHCREAHCAEQILTSINKAVMHQDHQHTFDCIKKMVPFLPHVSLQEHLSEQYHADLRALLQSLDKNSGCHWVQHTLSDKQTNVYFNLKTNDMSWNKPDSQDFQLPARYLSWSQIESVVQRLNQRHSASLGLQKNQYLLMRFQAHCRGFIVRHRLFSMLQHYCDNEDKVIKVQAVWRGVLQRRRWRQIKANATFKPSGPPPKVTLAHYNDKIRQIVMIQRYWRSCQQLKNLRRLMLHSKEIDLNLLRKCVHLLALRPEDFDQELQMQSLKDRISHLVRQNQDLEKDLDAMDIKIGLLIKNRIDVEDVVAHNNKLLWRKRAAAQHANSGPSHAGNASDAQLIQAPSEGNRGLLALKKDSRQKLEAYQHLFYQLQTEPGYLAKLVFEMPHCNSTKFLESVILTLYNYGANPRDEYLLLKLFSTALEEEVRVKVDNLSDVVSGNPLVVRLIISFFRKCGNGSLRELLGPLIQSVLTDKNLYINTNPVEIYKMWINSLEFDSGRASNMPHDVSIEQALSHEEVQKRLQKSILQLKRVTTLFLATIVKSKKKLPFGLLYMAKVLYSALKAKFPHAAEKEVLKIVGNLIYYRFLNPAIVAPDGIDIIDRSLLDNGSMNCDQRRKLGCIAKILQFAATKKGFDEDVAHLQCLNGYIVESHEKLKAFFAECCHQDLDLEEHFCIDQYSDATLIAKPMIRISLQELCDTHSLLLQFRDKVAPSPKDRLHELLDDLGEDGPSLLSLIGVADDDEASGGSLAHLAKSEVRLTLSSKFPLSILSERGNKERLFVRTKQHLASVLPCTKESNLIGCLKSTSTPEQRQLYLTLIDKKMKAEKKAANNADMLNHTNFFEDDESLPQLDECKVVILRALRILDMDGYVTMKDGCQAILVALAKDICNQSQYRVRRVQEIFRLKKTIAQLESKAKFHEEQVNSYNEYLKQCLASLKAKRRVRFADKHIHSSRLLRSTTLRYPASKLHAKGILISINGLPENQLKNVLFEFVPNADADGVFEIHAKFMGVHLEHVEVDIQELLRLQYEGVSVLNMFGKAKINVNLLLYFINAKFYGRKRRGE